MQTFQKQKKHNGQNIFVRPKICLSMSISSIVWPVSLKLEQSVFHQLKGFGLSQFI